MNSDYTKQYTIFENVNIHNCLHYLKKNVNIEYMELCTFFQKICKLNIKNCIHSLKDFIH